MDNKDLEYGRSGKMHDIISGIRDLLREASNEAQKIDTAMIELGTIKRKYEGEIISKGEYDINGKFGTIYTQYESDIIKNLLNVRTEYWNPNWVFISWEELFSKTDKINAILGKIGDKKEELENILIKSSEIKTKIETIFKYLP